MLDMGESVRIMDLAKRVIQLSGFSLKDDRNPLGDIEIRVTGLRPGEKLYEELLIGDNPEGMAHERIMKALESFLVWSELALVLTQLREAAVTEDRQRIGEILTLLVDGYGRKPESSGAQVSIA